MNFVKVSVAMALATRAEIETWQCTLVAVVVVISGTWMPAKRENTKKAIKGENKYQICTNTLCHHFVLKKNWYRQKDKREIFSHTEQNRFVNLYSIKAAFKCNACIFASRNCFANTMPNDRKATMTPLIPACCCKCAIGKNLIHTGNTCASYSISITLAMII